MEIEKAMLRMEHYFCVGCTLRLGFYNFELEGRTWVFGGEEVVGLVFLGVGFCWLVRGFFSYFCFVFTPGKEV